MLYACALKGVIKQDREHKANGHAGEGFKGKFYNVFHEIGSGYLESAANIAALHS